MASLNFDDGIKRLEINGDSNRVLEINTRDIGILSRLIGYGKSVETEMTAFEKEIQDTDSNDAEQLKDIMDRVEQSLRDGFDKALYDGASNIVFGSQSMLAFNGDGKSVILAFVETLLDAIKPDMEEAMTKSQKNVNKYKQLYDHMPKQS